MSKIWPIRNLLCSAEVPREGEAALLTRLLEFVSLVTALEYRGPREDRFMFRAATERPAGVMSSRLLAATAAWLLDCSGKEF